MFSTDVQFTPFIDVLRCNCYNKKYVIKNKTKYIKPLHLIYFLINTFTFIKHHSSFNLKFFKNLYNN